MLARGALGILVVVARACVAVATEATRETVLIVGASRGLGLGFAQVYAGAGAIVHATARNLSTAVRLTAFASKFPSVTIHPLDVRDAAQISSLADALSGTSVDLLIYSAGTNAGDLDAQAAINAHAPFAVLERLLPAVERSVASRRRVCLITSDLGTPLRAEAMGRINEQAHNYALSKMAANKRFRIAEPSWRELGIAAIAMQPGKVKTDMNGRGNLSPTRAASSIKKVLDKLTLDQSGSFLNYQGVMVSWETGRPCAARGCSGRNMTAARHARAAKPFAAQKRAQRAMLRNVTAARAAAKPRAARRRAGGGIFSAASSDGAAAASNSHSAWLPFVGTPAEVLQQHPDPLDALSNGKVPAIVLKQQIDPLELAALNERLFQMHAQKKAWVSNGPGGYIGVAFTSALKWNLSPKRYAALAPKVTDTFRRHGIYGPIEALYGGLRALSKGRTVRTARDVQTNLSFTPATFRMQPNGTVQPKHVDSLQAFERLACRESCGCAARPRRDKQQRRLSTFDDMRRFKRQLSALVLLQRSDMPSPEVSVYEHYIDDIEKDCALRLGGMGKNPPLTNAFALNYEPSTRRTFHAQSTDIRTGDVYIFNSNFLHEVHPISVRQQTRMSISTFVGFSDDEIVVWG